MNKKAIILDLDNTIYPVVSIGEELFHTLFKLIVDLGEYTGEIGAIKKDIMRKPFQKEASEYRFSDRLTREGIELLKGLTYEKKMEPFSDFAEVRRTDLKKFLVTTGFTNMQQSKVKQLGLEKDIDEIHVVDPLTSNRTKKDVFQSILENHHYQPAEVLVVGDDPDSEIKAAHDLGIDAVLYDRIGVNENRKDLPRITDFKDLAKYL